MSLRTVHLETLAPVSYVPRRARSARRALVAVPALVSIREAAPSEVRTLLVHAGQGRSANRPIMEFGARLYTPVMRWDRDAEGPVPADASALLAERAGGDCGRQWDWSASTALSGTPLLARSSYEDGRVHGDGPGGAMPDGEVLSDGRDLALAELRRFAAEDLLLSGGALLVRFRGPLIHLHADRWTLPVSLNPALVEPSKSALPGFYPLAEARAAMRMLREAGIMRVPRGCGEPAVEHLDPNGRAPDDLLALPADPDARSEAARATALQAPTYALGAVRRLLGLLGPEAGADLARLAAPVMADQPWTRMGHFGGRAAHEVLGDAATLLERAVALNPGLMPWHARSFHELVRGRFLPDATPEAPAQDAEALWSLVP